MLLKKKKAVMKNKKGLFFIILEILFSLGLFSCGGRPSNVLSEDKMVNLMVDMELAEAYQNTQGTISSQDRVEMGRRVLAAHSVSEETLDTTLAWYGRNMDDYSRLFDKVDKEILKRKQKYTEIPGMKELHADNLWPYSEHLVISPLSGYEYFSFILPNTHVKKGEILELSFHLPNSTSLKGILGVEYTDQSGESVVSNNSSRNRQTFTLQTDTAREVANIYGTIYFKDRKDFPVYIDSIFLQTLPIDSLTYRSKKRSQKGYSVLPQNRPQEKINLSTDSVKLSVDSIKDNLEEEKRDTIIPQKTNERHLQLNTPMPRSKVPTKDEKAVMEPAKK